MTTLREALGLDHPEADYELTNFWKTRYGVGGIPVLPYRNQGSELNCTPNEGHKLQFDQVNNPAHYTEGRKHEPVDVITDWNLDFCLGNVVKYISRAGRKDPQKTLEDLKKARFYLDYKISLLQGSI